MTRPTLKEMAGIFARDYRGHRVYEEQALETYERFLGAVDVMKTRKREGFDLLEPICRKAGSLSAKYFHADRAMLKLRDVVSAEYANAENRAYNTALSLGFRPRR